MVHSEYELKCQLYGAWKYAEGRGIAGEACGPIAATFAAYAAWLKWDSWIFVVVAFILIYKLCTYGNQKAADEAFDRYESYTATWGQGDYRPGPECLLDEIEQK